MSVQLIVGKRLDGSDSLDLVWSEDDGGWYFEAGDLVSEVYGSQTEALGHVDEIRKSWGMED